KIPRAILLHGCQISRYVVHVLVIQRAGELLVRRIGIMHFDFRLIAVARDGAARTIRLDQGHNKIVLADQRSFQFLAVGKSHSDGLGRSAAAARAAASPTSTLRVEGSAAPGGRACEPTFASTLWMYSDTAVTSASFRLKAGIPLSWRAPRTIGPMVSPCWSLKAARERRRLGPP